MQLIQQIKQTNKLCLFTQECCYGIIKIKNQGEIPMVTDLKKHLKVTHQLQSINIPFDVHSTII